MQTAYAEVIPCNAAGWSKGDVIIWCDPERRQFKARFPRDWSNRPRRNSKQAMLGCERWQLEWLPNETIPVVFRIEQDGPAPTAVALFPTEPATNDPSLCTCYAHLGQHCAADYNSVIQNSRPASIAMYQPLLDELTIIGYRLRPIRNAQHSHHTTRMKNLYQLAKS